MARYLLTDAHVRNAKAKDKPFRLKDGDGLFLFVPVSGVRSWQYRYLLAGKAQTATLGKLNEGQGLAWARAKAEEARKLAAEGRQVTTERKVARAKRAANTAATFEVTAAEWVKIEAKRAKWTPDYKEEVKASLANHLSKLDPLPIAEISAAIAAPYLRKIERNAPDMAKKVRQRLRAIFDHAVEDGVITGNPIPAPRRRKAGNERTHLPATLAKDAVGEILRAADKAEGCKGLKRAHLVAAFTAQRIGEIVGTSWSEIDLQSAVWSIPRDRMKRKDVERGPHLVPIPPRLFALVKEWHREDGDDRKFLCPAPRGDGPITREAVEKFYRRGLGLTGKHSPHSWRTVLSTWANDAGEDSDAVEAQLDHATGNKVKTSYDRAKRLQRRAELMAWHEGALIAARDGATVVQMKNRA